MLGIAVLLGLVLWIGLVPPIAITPGPTTDPRDPLATRFIATNRSLYELHDVHYLCGYAAKDAPTGSMETDAHILGTGASLSVLCDLRNADRGASHAMFALVVYYKIPMASPEFSYGATYLGERDADGGLQWHPDAKGMDGRETFNRFMSETSSIWSHPPASR